MVEIIRKAYLASIVPVIVNTVLDHHQLVVDIVAFVSKGDFPRSRLGEKQRGKILGGWVTRKMKTIAQFSIRDGDGADSQITEVAEPTSGIGSVMEGSSLRNVENAETPTPGETHGGDHLSLPTGISEMPANYESSIIESPRLPADEEREETPTEPHYDHRQDPIPVTHDPANPHDQYDGSSSVAQHDASLNHPSSLQTGGSSFGYNGYQAFSINPHHDEQEKTPQALNPPAFDFGTDGPPPTARYNSKPRLSTTPAPEANSSQPNSDLASLPSQQRYSSLYNPPHASQGSPRSASRDRSGHSSFRGGLQLHQNSDDDDAWRRDALLQLNLARGDQSRSGSRDGQQQQQQQQVDRHAGGKYDNGAYGGNGYGYGHAM